MQFATGDPAVAETAMGGAIWTRCLVPRELGDSTAAAELIMASHAVKEAVAHRILATELRQGPRGPTPLYLDALEVLHGTAADQVPREMKYLAVKMTSAAKARSQGKIKTEEIDEIYHPPDILTKPLKRKECVFKRGRLLGLSVVPPAKPSSGATTAAGASGAEGKADRARCAPCDPVPGTWGRALGRLLSRGRG